MRRCWLMGLLLAMGLIGPPCRADDLDAMQDRAWLLRQTHQESPEQIARRRVEVIREGIRSRQEQFLVGTAGLPLDIVLEDLIQLQRARLDLPADERDPAAIAAAVLIVTEVAYRITRAKFDVGKAQTGELSLAAERRAFARLRWLEAGRGLPGGEADWFPPRAAEIDSFVAETLWAVSRLSREQLRRDRLDAALLVITSFSRQFLAGAAGATLDMVLEAAQRMAEAGVDASTDPAEQIGYLEWSWRQAYLAEKATRVKFEVGRIGSGDLAQVHAARLERQITWLRAARQRPGSPKVPSMDQLHWPPVDPLDTVTEAAQARREGLAKGVRDCQGERLQAARELFRYRREQFLVGSVGGSLEVVLSAIWWVLGAELDLAESDAERQRILTDALVAAWNLERSVRARLDVGKATSGDQAQAVAARLEIQYRLAALVRASKP